MHGKKVALPLKLSDPPGRKLWTLPIYILNIRKLFIVNLRCFYCIKYVHNTHVQFIDSSNTFSHSPNKCQMDFNFLGFYERSWSMAYDFLNELSLSSPYPIYHKNRGY